MMSTMSTSAAMSAQVRFLHALKPFLAGSSSPDGWSRRNHEPLAALWASSYCARFCQPRSLNN